MNPSMWTELSSIPKAMWTVLRRSLARNAPRPSTTFRCVPVQRFDEAGQPVCTACRICLDVCPTTCISVQDNPVTVHIESCRCIACGLCVQVCSVGALLIPDASSWPYNRRECGEEGR